MPEPIEMVLYAVGVIALVIIIGAVAFVWTERRRRK